MYISAIVIINLIKKLNQIIKNKLAYLCTLIKMDVISTASRQFKIIIHLRVSYSYTQSQPVFMYSNLHRIPFGYGLY